MSTDIIARALSARQAARLASGAQGDGAGLVTFRGTSAGSSARTVESRLRDTASLKDFGAVGDGVANDTAAVQAWATHCATNHVRGYAPPGTYRLTATIAVPVSEGLTLRGAGPTQTVFSMATDNTAIFDLGGAVGDTYLRYVDFGGFTLTYANVQTSAMTSALPIRFSAMMFQSRVTEIRFLRGYYCMSVGSGVLAPWGCEFNNLFLDREVTGGFYDMLASGASSVPNNFYGRLGADALGCTQTLF
ncbi:MAG TPA: glycosyl hydrolase family 28-related protein, partial [Novosphingobium sp.]|nr:glycosyl hydrolase family 28-related protein [Novosphingobium sp.]